MWPGLGSLLVYKIALWSSSVYSDENVDVGNEMSVAVGYGVKRGIKVCVVARYRLPTCIWV